jgi:hypothetical protein
MVTPWLYRLGENARLEKKKALNGEGPQWWKFYGSTKVVP